MTDKPPVDPNDPANVSLPRKAAELTGLAVVIPVLWVWAGCSWIGQKIHNAIGFEG